MPLYIPNTAWEQAPSMPRRPISLSAQGLGTFEAQSVHTGVLAQLMAKQVGCSRTLCATGYRALPRLSRISWERESTASPLQGTS